LGIAIESDVAALRQDLGTISQKRWEHLEWHMPENEIEPFNWDLYIEIIAFPGELEQL
jgi:hypothetical protein